MGKFSIKAWNSNHAAVDKILLLDITVDITFSGGYWKEQLSKYILQENAPPQVNC
jgi:hypothetical protein